jgi:molecular chaperone DnaK
MTRTTIDIGIDLGTTNSCIAVLKGTEVEVLRNNEDMECTPSAVWLDRKDRMHVGQRAKEQYESDEENAAIEFKLQIGEVDGANLPALGAEVQAGGAIRRGVEVAAG